jgi:predicted DNA-binding helix-hairpin-helix protein
VGLRRIYFSAFRPIINSSLENLNPTPPMREHRLYQADWLLRVYGFSPPDLELALDKNDNLSLGNDPKLVIARKQPWLFPIDINGAGYEELIRVPGIGPVSAKRIIETRHGHSIFLTQQLHKMGVVMKQALPFIRFKGMPNDEKQLSFLSQLDEEMKRQELYLPKAVPVI